MIEIEKLSEQDLKQKIDNIKAECEKTANALKRYEEELERRKREVQLGVPAEHRAYAEAYFVNCIGTIVNQPLDSNDEYDKKIFDMLDVFTSKESAEKHIEMLLAWRKALVANSKGEPIDIQALLPLLRKGWVAMDYDTSWYWFPEKPRRDFETNTWSAFSPCYYLAAFNIKPAKNWETSLMECGL